MHHQRARRRGFAVPGDGAVQERRSARHLHGTAVQDPLGLCGARKFLGVWSPRGGPQDDAARHGSCEPRGYPVDTPWFCPPWRAAAAALTAGHSRTGSSSPSATRVPTAWRTASLASTRLTCRLRQEDCSLCDGVTNLKGYLSTKTGQFHSERDRRVLSGVVRRRCQHRDPTRG